MESKFSGLAIDLGISKKSARKLVREYFDYYKSVERISIYEYFDRSLHNGDGKLSQK
jgi:DNA polymerase I-like protein with 3'-5' exonuclease and polymerase domains